MLIKMLDSKKKNIWLRQYSICTKKDKFVDSTTKWLPPILKFILNNKNKKTIFYYQLTTEIIILSFILAQK